MADTLLISARLATCDPQFGKGIELLKMLPEDQTKMAKFREHQAHPSGRRGRESGVLAESKDPHNRLTAAEGVLR